MTMHFVVNFFLVVLVTMLTAGGLVAQEAGPVPNAGTPETAEVEIDGKVLFTLRGISSFPAKERAASVRKRILDAARDKSVTIEALHVEELEETSRILAGDTMLLTLFDVDAELEGVSRQLLAQTHTQRISAVITSFRADRSRPRLARNVLSALVATLVLIFSLWALNRLNRILNKWADRRLRKSISDIASKSFHLLHAGQLWRLLAGTLHLLYVVVSVTLIYSYLNGVLGLFPWTRPFAVTLLGLVLDPLRSLGMGLLNALPDLMFLVILVFVVRFILRLILAFFKGVENGRIRFESFDADWAMPTFKIVRVMVIAFSLVIAYPYIPGSDSMAFKGVSVFLGVLISLGSSSFIANSIAGLTMTYRGAFKEGDMVRIGDVLGHVYDIRLMVTRVRTPKNESVVLPNSNILNTDVINYSSLARKEGLMLHTEVGIGYDTPWRQVEALLLEAVRRTDGLLQDPPPFVLQKSLGDFTVNYEVNAMYRDEGRMFRLYSDLHANIQDVFNSHGVQIMSPHYVADPAEPKIAPVENTSRETDSPVGL